MDTKLESAIKAKGITELVIAGMQTEFRIDTSVKEAYSMGSQKYPCYGRPIRHMTAMN